MKILLVQFGIQGYEEIVSLKLPVRMLVGRHVLSGASKKKEKN